MPRKSVDDVQGSAGGLADCAQGGGAERHAYRIEKNTCGQYRVMWNDPAAGWVVLESRLKMVALTDARRLMHKHMQDNVWTLVEEHPAT